MSDKNYMRKDLLGTDVFDHRAYEDNEQMRVLSQMRESSKKDKKDSLSHHFLSFFRRKKSLMSHTR